MLNIGETVDAKYKIERIKGLSIYGVIYDAIDIKEYKPVSIIQFNKDFVERCGIDSIKNRFYKLVNINNPAFTTIKDINTENNAYCVYEWFEGMFLKNLVLDYLDSNTKMRILFQICKLYQELHERLIPFGPIILENIILNKNGVKVLPSWSKYPIIELDDTEYMHSYRFLSDSLKKAKSISKQSDLFSIAVFIHYIFYNTFPKIEHDGLVEIQDSISTISEKNKEIINSLIYDILNEKINDLQDILKGLKKIADNIKFELIPNTKLYDDEAIFKNFYKDNIIMDEKYMQLYLNCIIGENNFVNKSLAKYIFFLSDGDIRVARNIFDTFIEDKHIAYSGNMCKHIDKKFNYRAYDLPKEIFYDLKLRIDSATESEITTLIILAFIDNGVSEKGLKRLFYASLDTKKVFTSLQDKKLVIKSEDNYKIICDEAKYYILNEKVLESNRKNIIMKILRVYESHNDLLTFKNYVNLLYYLGNYKEAVLNSIRYIRKLKKQNKYLQVIDEIENIICKAKKFKIDINFRLFNIIMAKMYYRVGEYSKAENILSGVLLQKYSLSADIDRIFINMNKVLPDYQLLEKFINTMYREKKSTYGIKKVKLEILNTIYVINKNESYKIADIEKLRNKLGNNMPNSIHADLLNIIARTYYSLAYNSTSISIWKEELEIRERENDVPQIIRCLEDIAKTLYYSVYIYEGIKYYKKAAELAKENNFITDLSKIYMGLFNCYVYMAEFDRAVTYIEKIETIYNEEKNEEIEVTLDTVKLIYFLMSNRNTEALKYIKKFDERQKDISTGSSIIINKATEGLVYVRKNDFPKAYEMISICKGIYYKNISNKFYQYKTFFLEAELLYSKGKYTLSYNKLLSINKYDFALEDELNTKILMIKNLKYIDFDKCLKICDELEEIITKKQMKYYMIQLTAEKALLYKINDKYSEYLRLARILNDIVSDMDGHINLGQYQGIVDECLAQSTENKLSNIVEKAWSNIDSIDDEINYIKFMKALKEAEYYNHNLENQVNSLKNVIKISRKSIERFDIELIEKVFIEQISSIVNCENIKFYMKTDKNYKLEFEKNILNDKYMASTSSFDFKNDTAQIEIKDSIASKLITPIKGKDDKVLGMVVIENRILSNAFKNKIKQTVYMICMQIGIVIENVLLYKNLKDNYLSTIKCLSNTIEAKDEYTRGHCERVNKYASMLAKSLACSEKFIGELEFAAILHDIGKIGVPATIINKGGKLTNVEYNTMRNHPEIGYRILKDIEYLKSVSIAIHQHHERYDGKGYPNKLKGEEISLMGRILSVADTYDAMTSDRPYRKALSKEIAIEELKKCRGNQLDPYLVDVFIDVIG